MKSFELYVAGSITEEIHHQHEIIDRLDPLPHDGKILSRE
jgi:hypothetical protein